MNSVFLLYSYDGRLQSSQQLHVLNPSQECQLAWPQDASKVDATLAAADCMRETSGIANPLQHRIHNM
jgi:hypothetical protein